MQFDPLMFLRLRNAVQPPTVDDQAPDFSQLQIGQNAPAAPMPGPSLQEQPPVFENVANQRLMSLLSNMPQREKPSILARIGGVAAGIAHGPEAQENAMYGDYNRRLRDFNTQFQPTLQGAQLERQSNIAKSQQYSADRRADISDRRADSYNQRVLDMGEDSKKKTQIAQKKLELDQFLASNPELKPHVDETGKLFYVNPRNPSAKPIDTGINTGDMSDMDKRKYALEDALTRIGAAGSEKAALAGLESELGTKRDAAKIKATAEAKTTETQPPSQQKVDYYNKAQQAFNTYPNAKKFIVLGQPGTNDFQLKPPSRFTGFGMNAEAVAQDKKDFEALAKIIYGPNWQQFVQGNSPTTGTPRDPAGIR